MGDDWISRTTDVLRGSAERFDLSSYLPSELLVASCVRGSEILHHLGFKVFVWIKGNLAISNDEGRPDAVESVSGSVLHRTRELVACAVVVRERQIAEYNFARLDERPPPCLIVSLVQHVRANGSHGEHDDDPSNLSRLPYQRPEWLRFREEVEEENRDKKCYGGGHGV